jgi:hypothetical protein
MTRLVLYDMSWILLAGSCRYESELLDLKNGREFWFDMRLQGSQVIICSFELLF